MTVKDDYKFDMGVRMIMEGCKMLGWTVGFPEDPREVTCNGLVCGNETFMMSFTEDAPDDDSTP